MNHEKLGQWLSDLAAVCQCQPSEETVTGYLEVLGQWRLSDAQWRELKRRAILRHRYPRCLPMISELYAIVDELLEDERIQQDMVEEVWKEQAEPMPEDVKAQWKKLGL